MIAILRLSIVVVVLTCFTSCVPATSYELLNNTDSLVEITWGSSVYLAAPKTITPIFGSATTPLTIKSEKIVWRYAEPPFFIHWEKGSWHDSYITQRFPSGYIVRIQLEPDGKIYALKKTDSFPINAPTPQPGPFPMSPLSTN